MRDANFCVPEAIDRQVNEHLTADQAGSTYGAPGTWDYTYDSASNELTGSASGGLGDYLAASAIHTYDTADRLITTKNTDTQNWNPSTQKTP